MLDLYLLSRYETSLGNKPHNFHKKLAVERRAQMAVPSSHSIKSKQAYYNDGTVLLR